MSSRQENFLIRLDEMAREKHRAISDLKSGNQVDVELWKRWAEYWETNAYPQFNSGDLTGQYHVFCMENLAHELHNLTQSFNSSLVLEVGLWEAFDNCVRLLLEALKATDRQLESLPAARLWKTNTIGLF